MVLFLLTNCATIINGSRQSVSISSTPSNATVVIDGMEMGNTPYAADLARKEEHVVQINLPGYLPYEVRLTKKVDAIIAGNIILGGLIGLIVDAATGSMYKLTPDQVAAELKQGTASVGKNDQIFVSVTLSPNPEWEKIAQLEPIK